MVWAILVLVAFLGVSAVPSGLLGQDSTWNGPRVLQMIRDGRDVRRSLVRDSTLRSYSSQARGYVYFFLDRQDTGERILVKTDQIALEVAWAAPNLTKQRIVGMRDEKSLPTNIHYHLDHLLVVQDEFGDRIRIGGGDEVQSVLHPMAPGSEGLYDFLLADSVTLTLPGAAEEVRVYEIQVRPRDFDVPGFVGSVFLDRDTKAIVRMSFTFTPASYIDSYLDYIRISLENGLWMGRYWLPFKQELEIRREVPYLDFPAGSIIRGWSDIGDYEINPPLPPTFFMGGAVTALPDSARKAFPFEKGLYAQLEEEGMEGLRPPPDLSEIRSLALSIAKDRYLSGLDRLRLFLPAPAFSSAIRYDRAEGLFFGGGISYGVRPWLGASGYGGFSVGRERPSLIVRVTGGERLPSTGLEAFQNKPLEFGPGRAISGALNTLAGLTRDRDYTDLWFASGVRAFHGWTTPNGGTVELDARLEGHRTAEDVVSDEGAVSRFRPVLTVPKGTWGSFGAHGSFPTGVPGLRLSTEALLGRFASRDFASIGGSLAIQRRWLAPGAQVSGSLEGGVVFGHPPRQSLHLLGGRGTVPGYPFRSRVGDRYWLLRTDGSVDLLPPFLKLRVFGAAGGIRYDGPALPPSWPQDQGSSLLLSAGFGLGIGWDVLRLDLARGLRDGGEWEIILAVNREFWPWL